MKEDDIERKTRIVAMVSRQGRQDQRYNHNGHRLIVGCVPLYFSLPTTSRLLTFNNAGAFLIESRWIINKVNKWRFWSSLLRKAMA